MKKYIKSSDVDEFEDLSQVPQQYTSKDTSINTSKVPAVFKMVSWIPGTINLDYGGGKADTATEYLAEKEVTNLIYDPYNRSSEHNRSVIQTIRSNGGADTATCSNVLNVIKEEEARLNVLKNIRKLLKSSGTAYITVYEGKGTGEAKQSQDDAYQLHRKTADYLDEIHKVFPDATRKGKLIIATPTGEVTASCNFDINAGYDPYDLGDEDLGLPFVKEELLEFGDSIAETFSNDILGGEYGYQLSDIYVDTDPSGKKILLHIEFDNGGITTDATVAIDKRRIKRWTDLFKYQDDILNQMKSAHDEWYLDGERPEWYHEMEEVESSADIEASASWNDEFNSELERHEYSIQNDEGKAFIYSFDNDGQWGYHASVTSKNGRRFSKSFYLKNSLEKAKEFCEAKLNVSSKESIDSAVIPYKLEEFKKELQDKLYNKASKVLQTPEFGFPLNEIAEVLFVEIHEDDYNIIAEVRGELSYEGMDTLARALNSIVEKYSKDAYFDMVEPGIMEAYLPKDSIKKIQSSTVEGARFQETTDYDNPIGDTVTYDVEFDFKIVVSDDGDYDIPDTEKFESIYDDDYEIKIDDEDDVSEKIFDLIEYNVPEEPGTYRVSGIAKMKYDIDGIYIHTVAPDWDEELPGTEYVTDDVDIDFDEKGSWVEDFQCQKVD